MAAAGAGSDGPEARRLHSPNGAGSETYETSESELIRVSDLDGMEEASGESRSALEATLAPLAVTFRRFMSDRRMFTCMKRFSPGVIAREWPAEAHSLAVRCGHAGLFSLGVVSYGACGMHDARAAVELGRADLLRGLLQAVRHLEQGHNKLLLLAVGRSVSSMACVRLLLGARVNVNIVDMYGHSPLYKASRSGHEECLRELLAAGAAVDQATTDGETPLFIASRGGHLPCVRTLLVGGADVNVARRTGSTPLCVASQNGHVACVLALLDARAAVNQAMTDGETPLFAASYKGHVECVRALLNAGAAVDQATTDGETPLFAASQKGHVECVRALLESHANVDQAMTDGETPLFAASYNGHADCVRALLHGGAVVDQPRNTAATPLFVASQNGHVDCVRALLDAGADASTQFGTWTPISVARSQRRTAVVRLLRSRGAAE